MKMQTVVKDTYRLDMKPDVIGKALRSTDQVTGGSTWMYFSDYGAISVHLSTRDYGRDRVVIMELHRNGHTDGNYQEVCTRELSRRIGEKINILG